MRVGRLFSPLALDSSSLKTGLSHPCRLLLLSPDMTRTKPLIWTKRSVRSITSNTSISLEELARRSRRLTLCLSAPPFESTGNHLSTAFSPLLRPCGKIPFLESLMERF